MFRRSKLSIFITNPKYNIPILAQDRIFGEIVGIIEQLSKCNLINRCAPRLSQNEQRLNQIKIGIGKNTRGKGENNSLCFGSVLRSFFR